MNTNVLTHERVDEDTVASEQEEEIVHLICHCNDEIALCGTDVRDLDYVCHCDDETPCPLCFTVYQDDQKCPFCGCDGYDDCGRRPANDGPEE